MVSSLQCIGPKRRLVVAPGDLVPDLVGYRVRPVGYTGDGLGERGTFGVGEVGRLPLGRHGEEALVCFACLLKEAAVTVNADAAAIDLARAQLDKADRRRGNVTDRRIVTAPTK